MTLREEGDTSKLLQSGGTFMVYTEIYADVSMVLDRIGFFKFDFNIESGFEQRQLKMQCSR